MTFSRRVVLLLGSVLATIAVARSDSPLASAWASTPPSIDGLAGEWARLDSVENTRVSLGVQNDDRRLYLAIATSDPTRRPQLLAGGLIVWFDPAGGKKRAFGVRIPGALGAGFMGRRGGFGTERPPDVERNVPPLTYVEIIGPKDDDRRRVELTGAGTMKVARGQDDGLVVIELQVPLAHDDASPYAIGVRPGQVIGVGLETPKMERPEEVEGGRGRGGMGGRGGRGGIGAGMGGDTGGGRGGPGGAGRPGERFERPEPFKAWTTVRLATASVRDK